jgi:hypothetical protein
MLYSTILKKNLKKNIFLYKIVQNLLNFWKKAKRIFSFPLHLGENDAYPSIEIINNRKIKFFKNNTNRINFWTAACKVHPSLKHFYYQNPEESFINDKIIDQNSLYYSSIIDFYRDGVGKVENFFNKTEHKIILDYFKNKVDDQLEKNLKGSWLSNSSTLNKLISKKVKYLEKILFNKKLKKQKYLLAAWKKDKGNLSFYKESVNFHQDRFIPAIKLIYFPTDVQIDPFEYYVNSHIINSQFFENYKIISESQDYSNTLEKFNLKNYSLRQFKVKQNTMLIAATHGLHRRSQSIDLEMSGIRRFITISYYNRFTRYDLLKNFIKKKLNLN